MFSLLYFTLHFHTDSSIKALTFADFRTKNTGSSSCGAVEQHHQVFGAFLTGTKSFMKNFTGWYQQSLIYQSVMWCKKTKSPMWILETLDLCRLVSFDFWVYCSTAKQGNTCQILLRKQFSGLHFLIWDFSDSFIGLEQQQCHYFTLLFCQQVDEKNLGLTVSYWRLKSLQTGNTLSDWIWTTKKWTHNG